MIVAEVTGSVVSTRKNQGLVGCKLLTVKVLHPGKWLTELVVVDNVGAGIGEKVLVVTGSAARKAAGEDLPVDAVAVGIIDPASER